MDIVCPLHTHLNDGPGKVLGESLGLLGAAGESLTGPPYVPWGVLGGRLSRLRLHWSLPLGAPPACPACLAHCAKQHLSMYPPLTRWGEVDG